MRSDSGHSYMHKASAGTNEVNYPTDLAGSVGGASTTATNSVFLNNRDGILRSVVSSGTGTTTVEDHDGNNIMVLSGSAASGVSSVWRGAIRLKNGLRVTLSASGVTTTVEYSHGGQGNA